MVVVTATEPGSASCEWCGGYAAESLAVGKQNVYGLLLLYRCWCEELTTTASKDEVFPYCCSCCC